MSVAERFHRKVKKDSGSGCWIWTGATDRSGYGQFSIGKRGHHQAAHRASWELHHGAIPKGEGYHGTCVCHRCDTPLCVNPDHLFLGTQKENLRDASRKHRTPLGERQGQSKLRTADVLAIRQIQGVSQREIAHRYGVSQSTVSDIISRRKWPHV